MTNLTSHSEGISADQYQLADVVLFPAGGDLVLVYSKNSQAARFLRVDLINLLMQCQEFKTLDDHVQTYCRGQQMSAAAMRAMRRELQHLAQSGYLVSRSEIHTVLLRSGERIPSPSAASIGFPTCDRVEVLQRGMISYIEHCKRFARTNDFVVVDDSMASETRNAYRRMLQTLKSRYGVAIAYAGLEEKMAFARKLSEAGNIPVDIVSFACLGEKQPGLTTVGANRNALLLHTAGDIIFSSDDDILCRIAASPARQEGLAFSSGGNSLASWFFSDRESALQSVHVVAQDILAQHEQWLGQDPRACAAAFASDQGVSFEQAEPGMVRRLATRGGKIVLTLNGIIGDCSWDNPNYFLFQSGETFKRLTISEQAYRSARTSREMAQVANRVTITERADSFFAMCMGLDNRELLPPFTPLGRAEDIAFGTMLSKCFSATYTAQLPWLLLHAPFESRSFSEQRMFSVGFNSWIPSCISLFDPGFARTPAERLPKLGRFLAEIGRLPGSSFEEFTRQHMWNTMSALIAGLEERLQKSEEAQPAFWQQDANAFIAQARQSALTPIDQLYELRGGQEVTQRLLISFGQMLEWWPAMIETASHLRAEGYRLAQPI